VANGETAAMRLPKPAFEGRPSPGPRRGAKTRARPSCPGPPRTARRGPRRVQVRLAKSPWEDGPHRTTREGAAVQALTTRCVSGALEWGRTRAGLPRRRLSRGPRGHASDSASSFRPGPELTTQSQGGIRKGPRGGLQAFDHRMHSTAPERLVARFNFALRRLHH